MNGANCCACLRIDPVGFNGNVDGQKLGWLGHLSICVNGGGHWYDCGSQYTDEVDYMWLNGMKHVY